MKNYILYKSLGTHTHIRKYLMYSFPNIQEYVTWTVPQS
jgi:hypothetical protein